MDAGTGSEAVCENPHNSRSHDQAREVFHESKKLSSSSIPKDSGFFPFELLCHVVKWHPLLYLKSIKTLCPSVSMVSRLTGLTGHVFEEERASRLKSFLKRLEQDWIRGFERVFFQMPIRGRCMFVLFSRRFHFISPELQDLAERGRR